MAKGVLRLSAGIVLIAILLMMVSTEAPRQLTKQVAAQPLPTVAISVEDMLIFDEGIFAAVICILAKPEESLKDEAIPEVLYLLSVDGQGAIDLINVPVGTRVLLREDVDGNELYRYGTPVDAYIAGLADDTRWERLLESLETLFCGIPLERIIALEEEDILLVIDSLDGVYVARDTYSLSAGGADQGGDAPYGRPVLLTGEQTASYVSTTAAGTDTAALGRQNQAFAALADRLLRAEVGFEALESMCGGQLHHNLIQGEASRLDAAFQGLTAAQLQETLSLLWGDARMVDGQSWLPDKLKVKEYVLSRFYGDRLEP